MEHETQSEIEEIISETVMGYFEDRKLSANEQEKIESEVGKIVVSTIRSYFQDWELSQSVEEIAEVDASCYLFVNKIGGLTFERKMYFLGFYDGMKEAVKR